MPDENASDPLVPVVPIIVDPHGIRATFIEWLIDARFRQGVLSVTMGVLDAAIPGDNGLPRVVVASRLMFSREFAGLLHRELGNVLGVAASQAPIENEPSPPHDKLN